MQYEPELIDVVSGKSEACQCDFRDPVPDLPEVLLSAKEI